MENLKQEYNPEHADFIVYFLLQNSQSGMICLNLKDYIVQSKIKAMD